MNIDQFLKDYNESRNGANCFYRHWAVKNFAYSDGVQACANSGCFWLIDIIATEVPAVMRKARETLATVVVDVMDDKAEIGLLGSGDIGLPWVKHVGYTDMPEGRWSFLLADEGNEFRLILVSEY